MAWASQRVVHIPQINIHESKYKDAYFKKFWYPKEKSFNSIDVNTTIRINLWTALWYTAVYYYVKSRKYIGVFLNCSSKIKCPIALQRAKKCPIQLVILVNILLSVTCEYKREAAVLVCYSKKKNQNFFLFKGLFTTWKVIKWIRVQVCGSNNAIFEIGALQGSSFGALVLTGIVRWSWRWGGENSLGATTSSFSLVKPLDTCVVTFWEKKLTLWWSLT